MTEKPHQECPYVECGSSDAFPGLLYDPNSGVLFRNNRPVGTLSKDTGYLYFTYNYKSYLVHRVIFYLMEGRWPDQVDHKNRIRDDNKWANLREVSPSEQNLNKTGWGKSGKKGVYWNKSKNKWHVRVTKNKVVTHVGYFDDLDEAKRQYDSKASELHGEYFERGHNSPTLPLRELRK